MADNEEWVRYQRILDFLRLRKRAYQFTFGEVKNNEALKDLAKFARVGAAPWHPDEAKRNVLIGRQEMFFRIVAHLRLQPDELHDLYNTPSSIKPKLGE